MNATRTRLRKAVESAERGIRELEEAESPGKLPLGNSRFLPTINTSPTKWSHNSQVFGETRGHPLNKTRVSDDFSFPHSEKLFVPNFLSENSPEQQRVGEESLSFLPSISPNNLGSASKARKQRESEKRQKEGAASVAATQSLAKKLDFDGRSKQTHTGERRKTAVEEAILRERSRHPESLPHKTVSWLKRRHLNVPANEEKNVLEERKQRHKIIFDKLIQYEPREGRSREWREATLALSSLCAAMLPLPIPRDVLTAMKDAAVKAATLYLRTTNRPEVERIVRSNLQKRLYDSKAAAEALAEEEYHRRHAREERRRSSIQSKDSNADRRESVLLAKKAEGRRLSKTMGSDANAKAGSDVTEAAEHTLLRQLSRRESMRRESFGAAISRDAEHERRMSAVSESQLAKEVGKESYDDEGEGKEKRKRDGARSRAVERARRDSLVVHISQLLEPGAKGFQQLVEEELRKMVKGAHLRIPFPAFSAWLLRAEEYLLQTTESLEDFPWDIFESNYATKVVLKESGALRRTRSKKRTSIVRQSSIASIWRRDSRESVQTLDDDFRRESRRRISFGDSDVFRSTTRLIGSENRVKKGPTKQKRFESASPTKKGRQRSANGGDRWRKADAERNRKQLETGESSTLSIKKGRRARKRSIVGPIFSDPDSQKEEKESKEEGKERAEEGAEGTTECSETTPTEKGDVSAESVDAKEKEWKGDEENSQRTEPSLAEEEDERKRVRRLSVVKEEPSVELEVALAQEQSTAADERTEAAKREGATAEEERSEEEATNGASEYLEPPASSRSFSFWGESGAISGRGRSRGSTFSRGDGAGSTASLHAMRLDDGAFELCDGLRDAVHFEGEEFVLEEFRLRSLEKRRRRLPLLPEVASLSRPPREKLVKVGSWKAINSRSSGAGESGPLSELPSPTTTVTMNPFATGTKGLSQGSASVSLGSSTGEDSGKKSLRKSVSFRNIASASLKSGAKEKQQSPIKRLQKAAVTSVSGSRWKQKGLNSEL